MAWAAIGLIAGTRSSSADSVATLLGNYSISQLVRVDLESDRIKLHCVVDMAALPALKTLHLADANGDGSTSSEERNAYLRTLLPELTRNLNLDIGGEKLTPRFVAMSSTLPPEQGGFSLRFDVDFIAVLPQTTSSPQRLSLRNTNYAGQFGWHEIVVVAGKGVTAYDTNAFSTSATDNLNMNPQTLPASGPLDERAIHVVFTDADASSVAGRLQARPGYPPGSQLAGDPFSAGARTGAKSSKADTRDFFTRYTDRLVGLISTTQLSPATMIVALLVALLLGALHALSPGHGKTVVGAYLIGSRGTPRHAAFLGATVTLTHTLGVFALGFATLFASRYFVPQRIFPVLTFVSGMLVVVIGATLLAQRVRQMWRDKQGHVEFVLPTFALAQSLGSPVFVGAHRHGAHALDHGHDHDHVHVHEHGHMHEGATDTVHAALMHSHGGVMHSHLPPGANGEAISWRSLLSLGISGGLLPCPSALVLLLSAVALHRTGFGLVLVVAFSAGLALTLTAIGMMFLYARHLLRGPVRSNRLLKLLPIMSAAVITLLGCGICFGVLATSL
ncbi:MAG: nickel/cobalt transporter [Rudaea sp.]